MHPVTSAGHGEKRSRKHNDAIAALLECQTLKQAAEKAGIGERTLRTWLRIPDFRDAFQEAQRELVGQATSRLQRNFEFPVAVLQKIAGDAGAPATARVTAAKALLDAGFKAIELTDMTQRLRRIEERLSGQSGFKPSLVGA